MQREEFIVSLKIPYSAKNIEVSVIVTFRSNVIIKLNVTAEGKTAQMEKYLFRKANQWKVVSHDPAIFTGAWDKKALFEELQLVMDNKLSS